VIRVKAALPPISQHPPLSGRFLTTPCTLDLDLDLDLDISTSSSLRKRLGRVILKPEAPDFDEKTKPASC